MQDSDVSDVPWDFRRQSIAAIEALLRILHRALETFEGDLDDFVIYLAVVSASVGGAVRDSDLAASPPKGRVPARYYRGVSRRAIAASTGLPRETVRRRIAAFVERGLLIEQGAYVRAPEGLLEREDHREFAGQLIQEIQRAASQISRLAEDGEPGTHSGSQAAGGCARVRLSSYRRARRRGRKHDSKFERVPVAKPARFLRNTL